VPGRAAAAAPPPRSLAADVRVTTTPRYRCLRTAHGEGGTSWHYLAWIVAAPFVALLPIPLVAMVVAASPRSIKFLLGGQLKTAIREQTSTALHVSA